MARTPSGSGSVTRRRLQRIGRSALDWPPRQLRVVGERALAVDGIAEPVDDAPEQRRPAADRERPPRGAHHAVGPDAVGDPERQQDHLLAVKADHLGAQRIAARPLDDDQLAGARARRRRAQHQADELGHAAGDARRRHAFDDGERRCRAGSCRCSSLALAHRQSLDTGTPTRVPRAARARWPRAASTAARRRRRARSR